MRIALICPSNQLYMPYVGNYEEILNKCGEEYIIINWDRLGIERTSDFTYRDEKLGHRRNVLDYYKYCRFVEKILNEHRFDRVIVFGLQIGFFIHGILRRQYQNNYIIDIRDYNKIMKLWSPKKLIEHSFKTVISSPGYLEWLPPSEKYLINHNTNICSIEDLYPAIFNTRENTITISLIGAIRDYDVNVKMLDSLKNHKGVFMWFHGDGYVADRLCNYVQKNGFKNVGSTGRYDREEEASLYLDSDIINVLRFGDSLNNITALPNRLYNAAIYGKPLLAYQGTFLARQIQTYRLGLVLDSFDDIFAKLKNYFKHFDPLEFDEGRERFFRAVIADNSLFRDAVRAFCCNGI